MATRTDAVKLLTDCLKENKKNSMRTFQLQSTLLGDLAVDSRQRKVRGAVQPHQQPQPALHAQHLPQRLPLVVREG